MFDCEKNIQISAITSILCVGLIVGFSTSAKADANLNCDAYAQAAIDQQAQNLQLKCGFKGGAWSTNYNGHKNWCKKPGVSINHVSIEDKNRKTALKSCQSKKIIYIPMPLKDCDKYAQAAINQQTINLAAQCGRKGKGWSTQYNKHKNWCASSHVTLKMVNAETQRRKNSLKACF